MINNDHITPGLHRYASTAEKQGMRWPTAPTSRRQAYATSAAKRTTQQKTARRRRTRMVCMMRAQPFSCLIADCAFHVTGICPNTRGSYPNSESAYTISLHCASPNTRGRVSVCDVLPVQGTGPPHTILPQEQSRPLPQRRVLPLLRENRPPQERLPGHAETERYLEGGGLGFPVLWGLCIANCVRLDQFKKGRPDIAELERY